MLYVFSFEFGSGQLLRTAVRVLFGRCRFIFRNARVCVVFPIFLYLGDRPAYRERAAAAASAPVKEAPASAPAPVAPSASAARPATAAAPTGEVELSGVSEREAAMIMAIVANAIGKPPAQLRFHSIKEVKRP